MSLIARIAARKVARLAGDDAVGAGEVQPAAMPAAPRTGGIQRHANTERTQEAGDAANLYTGAIRPSQPMLDGARIKDILDTKDRVAQRSRVGVAGYVHASTLCHGICTRHYAINVVHERIDWEAVTGGHRLMWAYGRAAEAHIRGHLTDGDTYGFQIFGQWKCPCQATVHVGTRPKIEKTCPTCRQPLHTYHEQPWFDHENKFVGNPDLGVFIGRYYFPIEIKSMTADQWDKLEKPLAEHVNQALLYRYLAKINGFLVHDKVVIIYAKKEFKWGRRSPAAAIW